MGKKNLAAFIFCLFLLACVAHVSALTEDFSAVSSEIVYAGECSSAVNKILVSNTGSITSSYTVSLEGDSAKWTTYTPNSFVLKPGKTEEVYVYLKVPCNSKGKYDLYTYINTLLGVEKLLKQEVSIRETHNIEIEPVVYSAEIDPCETAAFTFDITNTGDFPETYEFSAEPFSDTTVFSANPVTVGSMQTSRIGMYTTPSCDIWGNHSLKLTTKAKLSRAEAGTEGINLEVNRNYDFSLVFGDLYVPAGNQTPSIESHEGPYNLCDYDYGAIPVLVENNAKVPNTYYFELDGNGWTSLSGDVTSLAPGASAYLNINVAPPEPMRHELSITLNAKSELGGIEKSETGNIFLDICHIPAIAEGVNKIKTYYEESYTNLTLVNTGSKPTNYLLGVEGADWISLTPSSLELAPGEEGYFNLNLQPTNETPEGKYYLTVKAGVNCLQGACSEEYQKPIKVVLKEPRFSNMIFDEYLLFTILFIVLLVFAVILIVAFVVYLEKTKEKRAKANEKRKLAKEKKRLAKEKAKEKIRLAKEQKRLAREKKKEQKRLAKLKEKEKRKLEKEKKKKEKLTVKFAAAKKLKIKPVAKKRPLWIRILFWLVLIVFVIIVGYIIYELVSNLFSYKLYLLVGAILAAAIIILLILGEYLVSRWYKEHVWKKLVPREKGVVFVRWRQGLGELVIKLKKPVEKAKISIKKIRKTPTFAAAGEKVYQYFGIRKTNFENRDIEKVSFRFRIKKKWLAKHNIPERTIKLVRYNKDLWIGVGTRILNTDRKYVYYEAISAGCSLFAIVGKPKPKKEKKEEKKEKKPVKKVEAKPIAKNVVKKIAKIFRTGCSLFAIVGKLKPKKEKKKKKKEKKPVKKVEAKPIAKKVAKKKKKPKSKKQKSDALKWLGFIVLALIIAGIIGYGIFYALQYIPGPTNDTTNITPTTNLTTNITTNATTNITPTTNITTNITTNATTNITPTNLTTNITPTTNITTNITTNATGDEDGIPTQEWDEDTQHTLDLATYFYDPDDDVLIYTHTPLEHIIISIDDEGLATLTPERNWHGEESTVFTADDGKGGTVSSNNVSLIVRDVEEPPIMERLKEGFSTYSNYVMVGLLILVILILLIEFRKPIMKFLEED